MSGYRACERPERSDLGRNQRGLRRRPVHGIEAGHEADHGPGQCGKPSQQSRDLRRHGWLTGSRIRWRTCWRNGWRTHWRS